jgi:hypothetical protein
MPAPFQAVTSRNSTGGPTTSGSCLTRILTFDPHSILEIVIDDEIQFLIREAIALRQNSIDLVDDWFAGLGAN